MSFVSAIQLQLHNILKEPRSKKVFLNVLNSFLVKAFSVAITLSLVPITLHYTDAKTYGVWLTLSSTITWVNLFDLGLSNGLTNKLAASFATKETDRAKSYISTTYSVMILIVALLCAIFFALVNSINWNALFNTSIEKETLLLAVKCTFLSLCATFLLKPVNDILRAMQKHFLSSSIQVSGNLLALLGIILFGKYVSAKFIFLAVVLGFSYPLVLLLFSLVFYTRNKYLRPKINLLRFPYFKDIFSISIKFFIINASIIAILTSNNFLISFFVNPESVTYYTIGYRLFSIVLIFQYMIVAPLWPAFTEAYVVKDFLWIRSTISRINKLNFTLAVAVILMLVVCQYIYAAWIGAAVAIPFEVNLLLAIYVVIALYKETYVSFVNGSGQLNLQTAFSVAAIALQIPFAYFLIKVCGLGLPGILLLNIFWVFAGLLLWRYQYSTIISTYS